MHVSAKVSEDTFSCVLEKENHSVHNSGRDNQRKHLDVSFP